MQSGFQTGGLVIGGSSCVGKTTAARTLAERFQATHIETDRCLPREARFRPLDGDPEIWDRDPQELHLLLIEAAQAATSYLLGQIGTLANSGRNWILEGERIHPELIERVSLAGTAPGVLIVETDSQRLLQTLFERLPKFGTLAPSRRRAVAEVDRLYNVWLMEEEASHRGIRTVESQPWTTLADRILGPGL